MLSFSLDEHISPKVGEKIRQKHPNIPIYGLQTWEQGRHLQSGDDLLVSLAYSLTLVTYDLRTIPTLLADLAVQNRDHSGVIFIDQKTIPPNDFGLLIRSLVYLWDLEKEADWTNRVLFLETRRDV
ncbi:MAG: hypothetical protein AAF152_02570 [Cyanobacteria bacterium P01_A01_bin.114]